MGNKVQAVDLKTPSEVIDITFDYTDSLEVGETVVTATVACTVRKGADETPADVLSGLPTVSSPYVVQRVKDGVSGIQYNLKCLATTSDSRILELIAVLPVKTLA